MKTTHITFFDIKGIVHFEFILQGQRLHEEVHRERSELRTIAWIFHNNNAPARQGAVKQFLAQKSITEMEHPPYFPDLTQNGFCLFLKLNCALKELKLQDIEDIQIM
jgi:hypothetical protein